MLRLTFHTPCITSLLTVPTLSLHLRVYVCCRCISACTYVVAASPRVSISSLHYRAHVCRRYISARLCIVATPPRLCVCACRITQPQTHTACISLVFVEVTGSSTGASDSLVAWEKLQRLRDESEGGTYVLVSQPMKGGRGYGAFCV